MAAEIIRVVQELPTDELNPTFAPIAAACLAHQSFYFHEVVLPILSLLFNETFFSDYR